MARARADEAVPERPRHWLLDQFARYQARPAAWDSHPRGATQLAQYQEGLRALRDTSERGEELRRARNRAARQ